MNAKTDKALLVGGAIAIVLVAALFPETQLLIAGLSTMAFVYMALKYDRLKEKK